MNEIITPAKRIERAASFPDRRLRVCEQLVIQTFYVHSKKRGVAHYEVQVGRELGRTSLVLATTDKALYDYAAELEGTDTRVDVWWITGGTAGSRAVGVLTAMRLAESSS